MSRCDTATDVTHHIFVEEALKAPVNLMTFEDLKPDWMLDCGGRSGGLIRNTVDLNQQNVKRIYILFFIF